MPSCGLDDCCPLGADLVPVSAQRSLTKRPACDDSEHQRSYIPRSAGLCKQYAHWGARCALPKSVDLKRCGGTRHHRASVLWDEDLSTLTTNECVLHYLDDPNRADAHVCLHSRALHGTSSRQGLHLHHRRHLICLKLGSSSDVVSRSICALNGYGETCPDRAVMVLPEKPFLVPENSKAALLLGVPCPVLADMHTMRLLLVAFYLQWETCTRTTKL